MQHTSITISTVCIGASWKIRLYQKITYPMPMSASHSPLLFSVRALFVDFRKAFDLVDHNILITKLNKFNIPNCLLQWFQSYLSHCSQRVRINRSVSSWQSLNGSMPQGSCLGPLSFTVMIDDLQSPCELHKFVDDTMLSELVTSSCSVSNMPFYFASLLSWTEDNNMQINISKTKEMVLDRLNIYNLPLLST